MRTRWAHKLNLSAYCPHFTHLVESFRDVFTWGGYWSFHFLHLKVIVCRSGFIFWFWIIFFGSLGNLSATERHTDAIVHFFFLFGECLKRINHTTAKNQCAKNDTRVLCTVAALVKPVTHSLSIPFSSYFLPSKFSQEWERKKVLHYTETCTYLAL